MGHPAEKRRPATYADLQALPEHLVGEIIGGELFTMSRPAPKHAEAASVLGMKLGPPFRFGDGGPGGRRILDEPELHLGADVVVPDLAGWTLERMPTLPEAAYFELVPDWVCEVLSPSTEEHDRAKKMFVYARAGIPHLWLVDPLILTLEVFALNPSRKWVLADVFSGHVRVRAEPFDAIELDLAALWGK